MRERGAALLTAMLTVALVATFAAAALWQQWRGIEVEQAERARIQSDWILTGALDWARLVLREDARAGSDSSDWLGEPWAVPLQEARLSSFLAADPNQTADATEDVLDAFLSGQIVDMQSLMNVNNLLESGRVSEDDVAAFGRLFDMVGAPAEELGRLVENLRLARDTSGDNLTSAKAPLPPQTVDQLAWLGLSASTLAQLRPYITVLPGRTQVNLNTASAEVIAATTDLSMAEAQTLVQARGQAHFRSVADAQRLLGGGAAAMPEGQANVTVSSRFFEVRSRLRLDKTVVEERALLQRDGLQVQVLRRERGTVADPANAQIANR
ncbi:MULTISPECIES: type II secretion system minor pseudopilin GspK [Ramlibacter]|uniref:Type II secretion system protein K n=1 Tax=Ramlibacter aquaticus TaxID=2780094 RepID=A0ABR9SKZ6_9BURK|nr:MULTISPECIES: type II secretion system minor pseudopilin GspK [Ramlibacter]MBE7942712.1 type II secretion system minor pseudopilin GspK [Ramlibacter aquaticus]